MREIFKASTQTAGAAVSAIIFTLIATKILALISSTEGVGLFSLLNQTRLAAIGLATFGGSTALVQGIANRTGEARHQYITTVLFVFLIGMSLTTIVLVGFAPSFTTLIIGESSPEMVSSVRWLTVPVVIGLGYAFLYGVLNGYRAIGQLALAQMVGPIVMALLAYPAGVQFNQGHPSSFIALLTVATLAQALMSLWFVRQQEWLKIPIRTIFRQLSKEAFYHFCRIAGVMFLTGQLGNLAVLGINALVKRIGGFEQVGIFNASWSLSNNYLMLILTSFTTYYMPTLSQTKNDHDRIQLMENVTRFATIASVPLITSMVLLKPLVITTLYTTEFLPALSLFRWMLIGDYLKVASFIVAMPVLAYANMQIFLITESAWYLFFFVISAFFLSLFHFLPGIGIAFDILYLLYLAFYLHYVQRKYAFQPSKRNRYLWLVGFLIIITASIYTWNNTQVDWLAAIVGMGIVTIFAWFVLTTEERQQIVVVVRARLGMA